MRFSRKSERKNFSGFRGYPGGVRVKIFENEIDILDIQSPGNNPGAWRSRKSGKSFATVPP